MIQGAVILGSNCAGGNHPGANCLGKSIWEAIFLWQLSELRCSTLSSRSLCEPRKIWEFSEDSDTVIIKHSGFHSCSPVKPKRERELPKEIVGNPHKSSIVRRDIFLSLVYRGADLEIREGTADHPLNCTRLNKL